MKRGDDWRKTQEIYNIIETLPEELYSKVLDYIEYLKFTTIIDKAPNDLIIKDKKDLRKKIEEGIQDSKDGKVCSMNDVFEEVEKILKT